MFFKNHWDRKERESIEKLKVHSLHRLNLVEEGPWKQKQCITLQK